MVFTPKQPKQKTLGLMKSQLMHWVPRTLNLLVALVKQGITQGAGQDIDGVSPRHQWEKSMDRSYMIMFIIMEDFILRGKSTKKIVQELHPNPEHGEHFKLDRGVSKLLEELTKLQECRFEVDHIDDIAQQFTGDCKITWTFFASGKRNSMQIWHAEMEHRSATSSTYYQVSRLPKTKGEIW